MNYHAAGHFVYISRQADNKLKDDGEKFYQNSLNSNMDKKEITMSNKKHYKKGSLVLRQILEVN